MCIPASLAHKVRGSHSSPSCRCWACRGEQACGRCLAHHVSHQKPGHHPGGVVARRGSQSRGMSPGTWEPGPRSVLTGPPPGPDVGSGLRASGCVFIRSPWRELYFSIASFLLILCVLFYSLRNILANTSRPHQTTKLVHGTEEAGQEPSWPTCLSCSLHLLLQLGCCGFCCCRLSQIRPFVSVPSAVNSAEASLLSEIIAVTC